MKFSKRMIEVVLVIAMFFPVALLAIAIWVPPSREGVVGAFAVWISLATSAWFIYDNETTQSPKQETKQEIKPVIDDAAWREQITRLNGRVHGGYVYVIRDADVTGYCKIGRSHNLRQRIDTFDVHLPFNVEVLTVIPCRDCTQAETILHRRFADKRVRGEWFDLSEDDIDWLQQWDKA